MAFLITINSNYKNVRNISLGVFGHYNSFQYVLNEQFPGKVPPSGIASKGDVFPGLLLTLPLENNPLSHSVLLPVENILGSTAAEMKL